MGRLTKRIEVEFPKGIQKGIELDSMLNVYEDEDFYDIANKLAHYEDLEEQGRLIEQKQGQWIYKCDEEGNTGNAQYECSECSAGDLHAKSQEVPYCWKCGAKMEVQNG